MNQKRQSQHLGMENDHTLWIDRQERSGVVVDSLRRYEGGKEVGKEGGSDILSAHPASFTHNFVSGMQSFYFSKSKGAMVLQTYNE